MTYKDSDPTLKKVDPWEPIFVLRAQDATAIRAIQAWLIENALTLSLEKTKAAGNILRAFEGWQEYHPNLVKRPD